MDKLTVTLKTVTPLFLGGADPNQKAELRAPSIKGAMRFWYRAIDPDYRQWEDKIFGSTDTGQGIFVLTLDNHPTGTYRWDRKRYCGYNEDIKPGNPPCHSSKGNNSWTINGNTYLGFSLSMDTNERKAIAANTIFTLKLIFRRGIEIPDQQRILAAVWLLGHVGGLGSRSRRGFGTVALQSWTLPDGWLKNDELPPIAHCAKSTEEWSQQFDAGLKTIRQWFPNEQTDDYTVIKEGSVFYLFRDGNEAETKECKKDGKKETKKYASWEAAMDAAGKAIQRFRQRWDLSNSNSDYYRVKQHLFAKARQRDNTLQVNGLTAQYLQGNAPERTAFGLPLTFRYGSLPSVPPITFQGVEHDRSASPLFIRIIEINGKCHPFFAFLNSPLLAPNEKIADQKDIQRAKQNGTSPKSSYTPSNKNILQEFIKTLHSKSLEVKWETSPSTSP